MTDIFHAATLLLALLGVLWLAERGVAAMERRGWLDDGGDE